MRPKVLLTGATGIFGRKFIEKYHDDFDILGVARKPVPLHANRFSFLAADLTTDIPKIIAEMKKKGWVPDVLINNAVVSDFVPFDHPTKGLEVELKTNLVAPVELIRACISEFWQNDVENRAKRRNIVNMSSIVGSHVFKINSKSNWSYATYAAAKAALNSLTFYLAHDLARFGIRINAVSPVSFPTHISTDRVCDLVRMLMLGPDTGRVVELAREFQRDFKLPEQTFDDHSNLQ